MKLIKLTAVLATLYGLGGAALVGGAFAAEGSAESDAPKTRAEVLAELEIWRESGLADLENGEAELAYTPRHDAALARYAALRAAPSFMPRVHRIAQRRGERVLVAGLK